MSYAGLNDAALAARLAGEAGELLLALRARGELAGKALGQAGDAAANRLIVDALRRSRPDDGLLSEESRDTPERLGKSRVWIVDPLDGTREYSEGRDDWAVHVALSIDGTPTVGAVAMPDLGKVYRTDTPEPLRPAVNPPRIVLSRTRPPAEAEAVAAALGASLVPMGGAGAKAMAVVRGEAEIYLHSGGQYEWDSCAPVAVARAHGLHASCLGGKPLGYNGADVWKPDLVICRQEWAAPVLAELARLASS